ncbi:L,D-transpeptidase family protein [Pseudochelatococcus sp. G4_1912]|uniref:L,D-transpeptidase family protein n=1 Tax=Pseudochelatococcus sp. G4_1912 TaxID=3114288 RepID=UPI0039C5F6CA
MVAYVERRFNNQKRMPLCLRVRMFPSVMALSFAALTLSISMPAIALEPEPYSERDIDFIDDLGIDPITTGSINPATRSPGKNGSGEDLLQPTETHYKVFEEQDARDAFNARGMPLPDMPLPVVIGAPDIKTMIGARLLGDENVMKSRLPQGQRDAIIKAYEARDYVPYWVEGGQWNAAARAVFAVLNEAQTHGLSPASYQVPSIASGRIQAQADADIRLSIAVATYARDARGARIDRNKLGSLAMPKLDLPGADTVLAEVSAAGEKAGKVLDAYHPSASGYQALRAKLIALQKLNAERQNPSKNTSMVRFPDGPALKIGQRDDRAPLIRARLGLNPVDDQETTRIYDSLLAEAASAFQQQQAVSTTGRPGALTVVTLAGAEVESLPAKPADIARLEAAVRVNMERWRWLPRELGERHIIVNVPEQDVKVIEDGRVIHRVLGIVGRAETPTPVFSDTLRYIVLNPSWNVPQSIVQAEIIPGIARDNDYARKRGYEIVREGKKIIVRQPPGVRNALGRVKFMFPNDLSIYLHDTPNRSLFGRDMRALSHGCVRVDEPLKLAETVLGNGWDEARLSKLIGSEERSLRLVKPMPIHLTYFTMAIGADGKTATFPDVYNYDQRLKSALDAHDKNLARL